MKLKSMTPFPGYSNRQAVDTGAADDIVVTTGVVVGASVVVVVDTPIIIIKFRIFEIKLQF